jgi:hypothetical protein
MIRSNLLVVALPLAVVWAAPGGRGASYSWWVGAWGGLLNNSEPVSVTISDGKVVKYAIRGGAPFGIEYCNVTLNSVSFGDHDNYNVKITKTSAKTAVGFAHSPMGDGSAPLTKQ